MPSVICDCGFCIKLGEIPCSAEYLFISDVDYDKFYGLINAEDLYARFKSAIQCQNCQRLMVYHQGFDNPPLVYELQNNFMG